MEADEDHQNAQLDELNEFVDYLNTNERGINKMFNEMIQNCAEKLEKFISFIKFVTQNKSHCEEVYFEDLKEIWKLSNEFKTSTQNFKSSLKYRNHSGLLDKLFALLVLKTPENFSVIGYPFSPIDLSPTSYSVEISKYLEIGKLLCETDCITKIRNEIKSLEHNKEDASSYAAIVGPSFTGKTQTAFTLSHLMDVFYVNLVSVKESSEDLQSFGPSLGGYQQIYTEFKPISKLFNKVLEKDISEQDLSPEDARTASKLKNKKKGRYFVLGLMLLLIRWKKLLDLQDPFQWFHRYKQIKRVIISELSVEEFEQKCIGKYIFDIWFLLNLFIFIFRLSN